MKTKLHKLIGTAVLGVALVSQSFPAWAGAVSTPQVAVGPSNAGGSMAGARYSAGSTQYIGCTFSNTAGPYVLCSATDATGKSLSCIGTQARHLAAAKAITDFSNIEFGVGGGSSNCSRLTVYNYSYHLK
ncbi:MAG: hypothetical protein FJ147_17170 [Deltaproteobacteria bacterium]|nr:hypothetical protein [Deltaproteobacteria bacterium]